MTLLSKQRKVFYFANVSFWALRSTSSSSWICVWQPAVIMGPRWVLVCSFWLPIPSAAASAIVFKRSLEMLAGSSIRCLLCPVSVILCYLKHCWFRLMRELIFGEEEVMPLKATVEMFCTRKKHRRQCGFLFKVSCIAPCAASNCLTYVLHVGNGCASVHYWQGYIIQKAPQAVFCETPWDGHQQSFWEGRSLIVSSAHQWFEY